MAAQKVFTFALLLSINIFLSTAQSASETETTYLIGLDDDQYASNVLFSGFASPAEDEKEKDKFKLEFPRFSDAGDGAYYMYSGKPLSNLPPLPLVQKLINYLTAGALRSVTRMQVIQGDPAFKPLKTKYFWTVTVTKEATYGPPSGEIIDETTTYAP